MKKFNGVSLFFPAKSITTDCSIVAMTAGAILALVVEGTGKKMKTVLRSFVRSSVIAHGQYEKGAEASHWLTVDGATPSKPKAELIEEDVALSTDAQGNWIVKLLDSKLTYNVVPSALLIVMDMEKAVKPFTIDGAATTASSKNDVDAEVDEDEEDEEEEEAPAKKAKGKAAPAAKGKGKKAVEEDEEDEEEDEEDEEDEAAEVDVPALQKAIKALDAKQKKVLVKAYNDEVDEDGQAEVADLGSIKTWEAEQLEALNQAFQENFGAEDGDEEEEDEEEDEAPAKGKKAAAAKGKKAKGVTQEQVNELDKAQKAALVEAYNDEVDDEDEAIVAKDLKDISEFDVAALVTAYAAATAEDDEEEDEEDEEDEDEEEDEEDEEEEEDDEEEEEAPAKKSKGKAAAKKAPAKGKGKKQVDEDDEEDAEEDEEDEWEDE